MVTDWFALAALVAGTSLAAAPARLDDAGDPLPEGAVARLGTLRRASYYTMGACFTPDGKTIRTIAAHRTLFCEWDAATGALLRNRPVAPIVRGSVDFCPDLSAYVVEVAPRRLRVVETLTGKTLSETALPPGAGLDVLAFSPDGKRFVVSGVKPRGSSKAGRGRPPISSWSATSAAARSHGSTVFRAR